MLLEKEVKAIKEELQTAKRPFFFFHDDPDGLASFLLFYRAVHEGKGYPLKAFPNITTFFLPSVQDYDPDKIFILDIPLVDQDFIDQVNRPIIWIDHHPPVEREKVKYYNSRISSGKNIPTPYLCWQVVQQDMWIAMVGCISEWYVPDFIDDFCQQYPDLLEPGKTVGQILYTSKVGLLAKIFSFNLKGKTSDVNAAVRTLTRIASPYEILNQETAAGRFIWKRYEQVNKKYQELLQEAKKQKPKNNLLVFTYAEERLSLTKDLANELMYLNPDKVIVLGREKDDEVRCSIRSGPEVDLLKVLDQALVGIEGHGGGHEQACGAAIKKQDFERFLKNLELKIRF